MFVEQKYKIVMSDLNPKMQISNTAILGYLESVGNLHSELAGFGMSDINRTRLTWVILTWKVKVLRRPKINDEITVRTWSTSLDRYFAYRDFEIRDQYGDLVCRATSVWSMINSDTGKLFKMSDGMNDRYTKEDKHVFEGDNKRIKISVPKNFLSSGEFKITRNLIDMNKHLHNIYYYDIAKEAIPEENALNNEFDEFEIHYKKEVKLGEIVNYNYAVEDGYNYVVINNSSGELSSIIKMR